MYYEPLLSNKTLRQYTGISRLTMAIMYLQVDRVSELLKEKDILDELPNYYFGYAGYKQTPIIALCTGNLLSNCHISFGDNLSSYMKIIKMLKDTDKIDLTKKDAFDKTYMDYINQHGFAILKHCL